MRLTAQSLTLSTRTWLHTVPRVRVLHVFPRVCNLIDAEQYVLSLVTPETGSGPFNVVVPPVDFTRNVTPADSVCAAPDHLRVGTLDIDLSAAAVWNPSPDWLALRDQRDRILARIDVLESALRDHAPANSLAHVVVDLPTPESAVEAQMLRVAAQQARVFVQGLRVLDRGMCVSSAARLAGLGGGLTPAGDDWLLGCALAAWIVQPFPRAVAIVQQAIRHAVAQTNPLSAAWLEMAAHGMCSHRWHVLLDCLAHGSGRDLYAAAREVVRQGHSSGADALAGFIAGLRV